MNMQEALTKIIGTLADVQAELSPYDYATLLDELECDIGARQEALAQDQKEASHD